MVIPAILFGISLYVGLVPRPIDFKVSLTRTIWSGIGIALGLFACLRELIHLESDQEFPYPLLRKYAPTWGYSLEKP